MLQPFISGIHMKRALLTSVLVFVWIFISDFLIHGMALKEAYLQTSSAWRPENEMQSYLGWMILGQWILAKYFTYIFIRGYQGKGLAEGIRFGVIFAVLFTGSYLIQYAVMPITPAVVLGWIAGGLVQSIVAGMIAAKVYKPLTAT